MCRFADRLAGHFDHKTHLVLDGRRAHRSRTVRARPADHPDRIDPPFLPPSSPEPNSDEPVKSWGVSRRDCSPRRGPGVGLRPPRQPAGRRRFRQRHGVPGGYFIKDAPVSSFIHLPTWPSHLSGWPTAGSAPTARRSQPGQRAAAKECPGDAGGFVPGSR
ncbi:transposase [Streptomyces sp. NPDC059629]|uniref:transposase n=1 Tax=Streptomyces sp. NPDC059629 TaxID=3346889 RepID=UPI0036AB9DEE